MYAYLHIRNLRGIRRLDIQGLRRINVFVGRNNTGKTTVLEGLFLLGGATNPSYPAVLGALRGQKAGKGSPEPLWRPLFYGMNPRLQIHLATRWTGDTHDRNLRIEAVRAAGALGSEKDAGPEVAVAAITQDFTIGGLRLRYQPNEHTVVGTEATCNARSGRVNALAKDRDDFVPTVFLSARFFPSLSRDAQQYSRLLRNKQEATVLEAVRLIEPRVERIEVLSEGGEPAIYADMGLESLIPLSACGEGLVRLFSMVVEVAASGPGLLLIDEIDNGLHHSVMGSLWHLLRALCDRHDVQIVATTHNDEMIRSAFTAFNGHLGELGLFRIDRHGQEHFAVQYDEESIQGVMGVGLEVRG